MACHTASMGEHTDGRKAGRDHATPGSGRSVDWHAVTGRVVAVLGGIVRWAGLVFAVILVLRVVFAVGEANPDNGIVSFVVGASNSLSLGFKDLFTPADPKLAVVVNYGIAALFWLVVSSVVARVIRRVGGVE